MKHFQLENGEQVHDLKEYVSNIFAKHVLSEDFKVYVGCDSQNSRYNTCYVTVIAFRFSRNGTHFIFCRDNVRPKIKDRWPRLWGEVERSLEVAQWLKSNGFKVDCVDLDFNRKEIARSNEMVKSAKGYILGFGFNTSVKPEEQVASRAADHIVRT